MHAAMLSAVTLVSGDSAVTGSGSTFAGIPGAVLSFVNGSDSCTQRRMWYSNLSDNVGRAMPSTAALSSAVRCTAMSCIGARSLSTSHSVSSTNVASSVFVAVASTCSFSAVHSCSLMYSSACNGVPTSIAPQAFATIVYVVRAIAGTYRGFGRVPFTICCHANAYAGVSVGIAAAWPVPIAACDRIDAIALIPHQAISCPLSGVPSTMYCSSS